MLEGSRVRTALGRALGRGRTTSPAAPEVPSYYPGLHHAQIPNLGVLYATFLGERRDGTFVEVGAFDGISYSNTWGLAAVGWSGLYLEAEPDFADRCRATHASHPRVTVVQQAVGSRHPAEVTFHLGGELTTGDPQLRQEYASLDWARGSLEGGRVRVLPTMPLDDLLEREGIVEGFDLLVVDVEGMEPAVLDGFTIERWHPRMMIWELADLHPDLRASGSAAVGVFAALSQAGYATVYKDHINTVVVRSDLFATWAGSASVPGERP